MDIQYKPSKPKKEKPVKTPKAPKAEKAMKFNSSVQAVKTSKPAKAPKAPKAPKPEKTKVMSFGKTAKVQTDKPMKVEKAKKPGILGKVDPKLILGGVLVLIAVITVVMFTVVIPTVEEHGQQIKSILVSNAPKKNVYLIGEEANYDGLRVLVTRNNGETFTVRAAKCNITGFDSSKAGFIRVQVEYEGAVSDFSVEIKEPPRLTPTLKSITMEKLPKTEYKLGEGLDTTGGVILCEYVDGSVFRVNLTNHAVHGYRSISSPGTYELTVKYMENGVIAETTYTITVTR